ncbi:MAG: MarR family transcriptional regulator [Candidatus Lambdaproteobacteria bacterium]|nr:MarR family transcriptional regulator [Candidatus Lambdaproteobacteria bacterium]
MGTHYKGDDGEVRALDAYIKLIRAADSVAARVQRHESVLGLTATQFGALEALLHLGPLCQRELGEKLLKSGGNITLVVDNLEKHGMVVRQRDQADRRFVTVYLTDAGRARIAALMPGHVAEVVRALSALSPREQEELGRLCRRLGLGTAAEGQGTPPCR